MYTYYYCYHRRRRHIIKLTQPTTSLLILFGEANLVKETFPGACRYPARLAFSSQLASGETVAVDDGLAGRAVDKVRRVKLNYVSRAKAARTRI